MYSAATQGGLHNPSAAAGFTSAEALIQRGVAALAAGAFDDARAALQQAAVLGGLPPAAALNLALAEAHLGNTDVAAEEMQNMAASFPLWDEPHVRLAELQRRLNDHAAAARHYEAALQRNPSRPEALIGLGTLRLQAGDVHGGQALLLQCCGSNPGHAEAWDALGLSLTAAGEHAEAEAAFAEAERHDSGNLAIALRRTEAARQAGTAELELARLELAGLLAPCDIVTLCAHGTLLNRLDRSAEAAEVLEAAVTLAPHCAEVAIELSNALLQDSDPTRAAAALRHAIVCAPDRHLLRNNLAVILMKLHCYQEARALFDQLIAEQGRQVGFLCNLSNALVSLGEQSAALDIAQEAAALAPDMPLAWRAVLNATAYHPQATGAAMLAIARNASAAVRRAPLPHIPALPHAPPPARSASPRVRVGLLSSTLKTHPVGWLTVAAFEHLEPDAFDVVCFGPKAGRDVIARRFAARASAWHTPGTSDPQELAATIRSCGIDILIDLGGYGEGGTMAACAFRPAPVQIKWVGSQTHSTGMPEMDWFLTDRWSSPPDLADSYSEKLLVMPDGYVCYAPPPYAPDVGPLPAMRHGTVTFGCFNNLAKITPDTITAWCSILARVPGARLVVKTHQLSEAPARERLAAAFAAHGIAASRIELRGASSHRTLLSQYNDIDIVLDPFPYVGGLTTCEALWMGVPTITLAGSTFSARHATSHMNNVGLPDWVATDIGSYCDRAMAKAGDLSALAALRAGLRDRVRASPLCDAPRFGRHLGAALQQAWQAGEG